MKYKIHVAGMSPIIVEQDVAERIKVRLNKVSTKGLVEVPRGGTRLDVAAAHIIAIETLTESGLSFGAIRRGV